MSIFISGGGGYLGSELRRILHGRGYAFVAPRASECDLTKADSLTRWSDMKFDLIYHLAAWTQAGDFCLRHPGEQWVINQQINTNMLAWWQAHQPQAKLVFMGTSCAYAPGPALLEEDYMVGEPIDSLYTYAMTKRMLLQGARAIHKQFGLRWFCAVPSTLYGPGYHTDGRQMHFIFDLVRKIIRGKEFGEPVVLWGDGRQTREVVYTEDFVSALLALVDIVDSDLVNIGAGQEFTIREFVAQICDIVGFSPYLIEYDPARYVGAKSKLLAIGKLQRLLPAYKPTPLSIGLQRTVEWFFESQAYLQTA